MFLWPSDLLSVSDDVIGQELGKSHFRGIMERTISVKDTKSIVYFKQQNLFITVTELHTYIKKMPGVSQSFLTFKQSRKPFEIWGVQLFLLRKSEKIQTWFNVKCFYFCSLPPPGFLWKRKVRLLWERCSRRTSLEHSKGSSSRTPASVELAERIPRE